MRKNADRHLAKNIFLYDFITLSPDNPRRSDGRERKNLGTSLNTSPPK